MAIERAGVSLVAENASAYLSTLKSIQAAQRDAFNPNLVKDYNDAIKRTNESFKNLPKNVPTPKLPPPDDAKRLQAALDLLGKTGSYNISKVSEEALRLKDALDTVKKSGQFDIKPNLPIKSDMLGDLTKKLDTSLQSPFKSLIGDVNELTGAIGGMVAKFTLVAGVIKVASDLLAFGQASIAVAQRNETLRVSLEEVGTQVGYTSKQIDLAVGLLNKQGITTQAAQQSLMRMARANISWAEASKLASIAQGSAVVAGMNSSDAFNRLVTGIQKMEPELLDELGITLRRTEAYDKFAATVGKNAKQLTDAEKQQAILNEIYAQSEVVLGVYGAAMDTSGKQQASLARYVEETQNNFGKLLLPLAASRVELETKFWKATQKVTAGLQALAPLLSDVLPNAFKPLTDAIVNFLGMGEDFDFFDRLGEGIYNFSRIAVTAFAATRAAGQTVVKQLMDYWGALFDTLSKGFSGDFAGAATSAKNALTTLGDTGDEFGKNFQANMGSILEKYPDLLKSWDEVNGTVEGSSEDLRLAQEGLAGAVEDAEAAIESQIETLEATKDAYKKVKDIQENFQKAQTDAKEDYEKGLKDAEEKYQKERARKIQDFNNKLAQFDEDNARKRAQMISEFEANQQTRVKEFALQRAQAEQNYNLSVAQNKRKFYEDQKKALRDFQLSQMQEARRFQVTDRRLRADGDVLALMEAREDFALQQQENQENFNNQNITAKEAYEEQKKTAAENFALQEEQARQSFALQTEIQREEFQRRLQEFDENIAVQRERMLAAHAQELADLDAKYEEEKTKLAEQYQEKLAAAAEQRDEQLKALGDSLKEEGKITEEGMKEIADKISEVFGSDAAGDQLIKGWSDRSKDEMSSLVDELNAQIDKLKENMKNASDAVSSIPSRGGGGGSTSSYSGRGGYSNVQPTPAAQGFEGTVTGPRLFAIEPGVREHVSITAADKYIKAANKAVTTAATGSNPFITRGLSSTPEFDPNQTADPKYAANRINTLIGGSSGGSAFGGTVEVKGEINVKGMESASSDSSDMIANTIVEELKVAIKKLTRKG